MKWLKQRNDCLFAVENGSRVLLLTVMKTLAFYFSLITVTSGRLVHVPTNQVAVVGERVQFNCSTDLKYSINWHRIPFGSSSVEYLYLSKTVLDLRFNVTTISVDDNVTGYSLIIPSAQKEDAGIYRCIDDAGHGEQFNAQLTILDSQPNCSSNIGTNGFICENDCGLQPEIIHCLCSLGYTGHTAPDMHWMTSEGSLISTSVQYNHRTVSSNVSMNATFALADASIVWYLAQRSHINWTSNQIKVLYVKQNSSSVVISHNKTFTCSAENNGICSYKWHAKVGSGHHLEASDGSMMTIHRPGQYFCTATCMLNQNTCTVTPLYVDFIFPESKDQSDGIMKIGIPIFIIVIILFVVLLIFIGIVLRRKKQLKAKSKDTLICKRSQFEAVKVINS